MLNSSYCVHLSSKQTLLVTEFFYKSLILIRVPSSNSLLQLSTTQRNFFVIYISASVFIFLACYAKVYDSASSCTFSATRICGSRSGFSGCVSTIADRLLWTDGLQQHFLRSCWRWSGAFTGAFAFLVSLLEISLLTLTVHNFPETKPVCLCFDRHAGPRAEVLMLLEANTQLICAFDNICSHPPNSTSAFSMLFRATRMEG